MPRVLRSEGDNGATSTVPLQGKKAITINKDDLDFMELEKVPKTMGGPNQWFLENFNLNETSHPTDWSNALPLTGHDSQELLDDMMSRETNKKNFCCKLDCIQVLHGNDW